MKKLPNGCSYSEIWVSPSNWATTTSQSALKKNWYVQTNFHDPENKDKFPIGMCFRKKCNRGKTLAERRALVNYYLEEIPRLFENRGYNPITGIFSVKEEIPEEEYTVEKIDGELHPDLSVADAFAMTLPKLHGSKEHIKDVRIAVNRFCKVASKRGIDKMKIKNLRYGPMATVMEEMELSPNYYNKFRTYFILILKQLIKHDCCVTNFAQMLDRKKVVLKQREVLDVQEFHAVMSYLKEDYYTFYRYAMIFFYSGTRSTELFSVRVGDVRLEKQEYDVLVKKGRQEVWETKVILLDAMPYWEELINKDLEASDYIFSEELSPGPLQINPKQVTRRWRKYVKIRKAFHDNELRDIADMERDNVKSYKRIVADFYSLKHTFLDLLDAKQSAGALVASELVDAISALDVADAVKETLIRSLANNADFDVAQKMAAHKSVAITNKVYKINKGKRENEVLKTLRIDRIT